MTLDYASDLGLKSGTAGGFEQVPMPELSDTIADEIALGQKVSVFGESEGYHSNAHNIHRVGGGHDGAIVLDPGSPSAKTLVFHFSNLSNQVF